MSTQDESQAQQQVSVPVPEEPMRENPKARLVSSRACSHDVEAEEVGTRVPKQAGSRCGRLCVAAASSALVLGFVLGFIVAQAAKANTPTLIGELTNRYAGILRNGDGGETHRGVANRGGTLGCGNTTCLSTDAFLLATTTMHEAMAIQYTCDAEIDFVRTMIPVHAAALTLCATLPNVVDQNIPTMLAGLCTGVERRRTTEMARMQDWLRTRGLAATTSCGGHDDNLSVRNGTLMGCGNLECASTAAFIREHAKMRQAMAIAFTCQPEMDFVHTLLPMHVGAIQLCVALRTAAAGRLDSIMIDSICTNIESAQELAQMEDWLASSGKPELGVPCE